MCNGKTKHVISQRLVLAEWRRGIDVPCRGYVFAAGEKVLPACERYAAVAAPLATMHTHTHYKTNRVNTTSGGLALLCIFYYSTPVLCIYPYCCSSLFVL